MNFFFKFFSWLEFFRNNHTRDKINFISKKKKTWKVSETAIGFLSIFFKNEITWASLRTRFSILHLRPDRYSPLFGSHYVIRRVTILVRCMTEFCNWLRAGMVKCPNICVCYKQAVAGCCYFHDIVDLYRIHFNGCLL